MAELAKISPIVSTACSLLLRRMASLKTSIESHCDTVQHKTPLRGSVLDVPITKYGGRRTVTMLPGCGIGPELMAHVKEVLSFAGAPVDFEEIQVDPENENDEDLVNAITSIKRNRVAIKGNIERKSLKCGVLSRNVAIRNELDLYINVLNCKSYPGLSTRHKDIDIVIMRQNTEGEYAMLEHESVSGVVENLKVVTRENSERVARYGFEYARRHGRKKVTTIHNANIMKLSDGLFLEVTRKMAEEYPDIEHTDMLVDNTCMQLVTNPHQFDVMITINLYGTIISNILCGMIGGAGLISGRNYGHHYAVFEPGTRNIGAELQGKNVANPVAMLNASVDLLRHLGYSHHANVIHHAIDRTVNEDFVHTPDLGGQATSTEVVHNIKKQIETLIGSCFWNGGHNDQAVQLLA